MPRISEREPFVPARFTCAVRRVTVEVTRVDQRTGERRSGEAVRWDVKGRADGTEYLRRFERAGLAEAWKRRLEEGFAARLPFDLVTKQFLRPAADAGQLAGRPGRPVGIPPPVSAPASPSVLDVTEAFYRSHPDWGPRTKSMAAAALNRARRWFLVPGAAPTVRQEAAVEDFLANASLRRGDGPLSERQAGGLAWLRKHSVPIADVTTADVEAYLARFEVNQRSGRKVSRATIVRYSQPVRSCWAWAVSRDDLPLERNPWLAVRPPRKVKGRPGRPGGGTNGLAVDPDIVLGVEEALSLADRCVTAGRWGEGARCFVLVMALCGLRPGEAAGIVWDDVELADDDGTGWLTVRRSRRRVAPDWLDPDDDPQWGPLRISDLADSRRVPVHPVLAARLRAHRDLLGVGPDGLVFHRNDKAFELSGFAKDVWGPARAEMFPLRAELPPDDPRQPKLSHLRQHDLRHAACSWWLRAGVDATVCRRWSGHKSLSVFLDVYRDAVPALEAAGVRKLVESFAAGSEPPGGWTPGKVGGRS